MRGKDNTRTAAEVLVDQLIAQRRGARLLRAGRELSRGARRASTTATIDVTVCRQEGGAAMMAEAVGKLTGRPGICFVTRGPGATNASPGVHIAKQDSTPMILFVGQVGRDMREREAFQELDYRAVFGTMAKWATEIDDPARIPEIVSRAFMRATSGPARPGRDRAAGGHADRDASSVADAPRRSSRSRPIRASTTWRACRRCCGRPKRPIVHPRRQRAGRRTPARPSRASPSASSCRSRRSFRRAHAVRRRCMPAMPAISASAPTRSCWRASRTRDLVLAGRRPAGRDAVVGLHAVRHSRRRSRRSCMCIPAPRNSAASTARRSRSTRRRPRSRRRSTAAAAGRRRRGRPRRKRCTRAISPGRDSRPTCRARVNIGEVMRLAARASCRDDAIVCNGAGNFASWVHRFYRFRAFATQLAPTSGSMGYGVPAAVGGQARCIPSASSCAFAGDGYFLMNGQEFATAVQYELPIIVIVVVDNGMYGTIRMHQEREYPGRVSATGLKNPDFAAYARAFGGHGETVEKTAEFAGAFERAPHPASRRSSTSRSTRRRSPRRRRSSASARRRWPKQQGA